MKKASFVITVAALGLSACTDKPLPPAIQYDAEDFKPAVIEQANSSQILEAPKQLPPPDPELAPDPDGDKPDENQPDIRPPAMRVEDANKAATQEPTRYGYRNATQIYPFTEGALYRLYAAPGQVSDIALQPGEKLTAVSAGDTVRWVIGDTVSGSGEDQRVHVLVKLFAPQLTTNLVIATDRRAYHLQLESTEKTAMAAISWIYAQDRLIAPGRHNAAAGATRPATGLPAFNLALDTIRFRYEVTGGDPPWKPLRAFDDGHKVYIAFPRRIDQGEAPPLFILGADGGDQLVNYRMHGNYYIVDRLFAAAELRLGTEPQQVVRIARTDSRTKGTEAAP